jgi:hypothetical protein
MTTKSRTPLLLAFAATLLGAGLSFGASAQYYGLGTCDAINEGEIAEIVEDAPGAPFGDYYNVVYVCSSGSWLEVSRQYCDFEQCYPFQ